MFRILKPPQSGLELHELETRNGTLFLIVLKGTPLSLESELLNLSPESLLLRLAYQLATFAAAIATPKKVWLRSDPHGGLCWYRSSIHPNLLSIDIESLGEKGGINKKYLAGFIHSATLNRPQHKTTAWNEIERFPPGVTWLLTTQTVKKCQEIHSVSFSDPAKIAHALENYFKQIMPVGPSGMLLSGGSDSTLLLNLTAAQGNYIEALNYTHSSDPVGRDAFVAQNVCDRWRSKVCLTQVNLDKSPYYKNMVSNACHFTEPSIGIYVAEQQIWNDNFFIEKNIQQVITGEGGDAFHGGLEYLSMLYRQWHWVSLFKELWQLAQWGNITRSDYVEKVQVFPNWLCLRQAKVKPSLVRKYNPLRHDAFMNLTSSSPMLETQMALSYRRGLSYHHPFLGEKPLALALALHPRSLLKKSGGDRAFYRNHLLHLLPLELHASMPPSHWSGVDITGFKNHFHEIELLFSDSQLNKLGWIDPYLFLKHLEVVANNNSFLGELEKRILVAEAWLQAHQF